MNLENILKGHAVKIKDGKHEGEIGVVTKNDNTHCIISFASGKSLIPIWDIKLLDMNF